jgi:hypothetical protein
MSGVQFIGALLFAPSKGLIGSWFLQKKQEQALAPAILCAYLSTRPQNARVKIDLIAVNLGWPLRRLNLAVYSAEAHGWVVMAESGVALTQKGYAYARKSAEKFCVFS